MTSDEDYLKLIVQVGNFTKKTTGTSIVDAYFGPENLSPERVTRIPSSEKLLASLDRLIDTTKDLDNELRRIVIASDFRSLKVVARWLSGDNIPYKQLVEGIFGITPSKFRRAEIQKAQQKVEDASKGLPGSNVGERIVKWRDKSKISGETLKKMINTEVLERTKEIEELFKEKVFNHLPFKVKNRGVIYKVATGEPWGAYNYYQGNFASINAINVDRPHNKYRLIGMLCHEYEHHIANVFTEHYYRKTKALDTSVALLHTKGSIINEGTADCAREFLNLKPTEYGKLLESLSTLQSMVTLNSAYMLNVENVDDEKTAEYISSEAFIPAEEARKSLMFNKPMTPSGQPNLFKPYIYTYYFGRKDYVLPTFQKAKRKGKINEFFQTLYLNPYSRSSETWNTAFSNI